MSSTAEAQDLYRLYVFDDFWSLSELESGISLVQEAGVDVDLVQRSIIEAYNKLV